MSRSLFISYLGVVALITVSPGPDTALVVRNALRFGTINGLRTAAGSACGLLVWGTASGLGVAAVLAASATVFTGLRLLGAAYLVWLGVRLLIGAVRRAPTDPDREPQARPTARAASYFRQGLVTNLLNPKAAAFFTALLPQFVTTDGGGALVLTLGLAVIACVASAAGLATYAAAARGIRRLLRDRVERIIDAVTGTVLVALGARLALAERT